MKPNTPLCCFLSVFYLLGVTASANADQYLDLTIELDTMVAYSEHIRCIELEMYNNDCSAPPLVWQVNLIFGGPYNPAPEISVLQINIPESGSYNRIMARDPLHSLWSSTSLTREGDIYTAAFEASDALVFGDVNGDNVIDVDDRTIVQAHNGDTYWNGDSPCGTPEPHLDLAVDGMVDTLDLSIVISNEGMTGVVDDCRYIPTVPEWGIVVMVLLTLAAGTVVYSRHRVPH